VVPLRLSHLRESRPRFSERRAPPKRGQEHIAEGGSLVFRSGRIPSAGIGSTKKSPAGRAELSVPKGVGLSRHRHPTSPNSPYKSLLIGTDSHRAMLESGARVPPHCL